MKHWLQKGVVLIVPHFGTWEVMNAWCAQFTSMTILYKPVKNADADRFVREPVAVNKRISSLPMKAA